MEGVKEGKRVTLIGAFVNAILSAMKMLVGWFGGSAALVADGLHSFSDLITDVLVYWVFRVAHRAPDASHPWGHKRIETLATIALAVILGVVAVLMAWDSVQVLLAGEPLSAPSQWTLIVAAISIIANEGLYWLTVRAGKKANSQLLIANAWHHRTDSLSSIVVLVAIAGAIAGIWWLDALAAVLVALLIGKVALDMLLTNAKELVDTAVPAQQLEKIKATAREIDGVLDVHSAKSRFSGGNILLELHIQVAPELTVTEGHYIGEQVVERLLRTFDEVTYVIYHIDTRNDQATARAELTLPNRVEIERLFSQFHARLPANLKDLVSGSQLNLHYLAEGIVIDVKLDVPMSANEAQDKLQRDERQLRTLAQFYRTEFADVDGIAKVRVWYGIEE